MLIPAAIVGVIAFIYGLATFLGDAPRYVSFTLPFFIMAAIVEVIAFIYGLATFLGDALRCVSLTSPYWFPLPSLGWLHFGYISGWCTKVWQGKSGLFLIFRWVSAFKLGQNTILLHQLFSFNFIKQVTHAKPFAWFLSCSCRFLPLSHSD